MCHVSIERVDRVIRGGEGVILQDCERSTDSECRHLTRFAPVTLREKENLNFWRMGLDECFFVNCAVWNLDSMKARNEYASELRREKNRW